MKNSIAWLLLISLIVGCKQDEQLTPLPDDDSSPDEGLSEISPTPPIIPEPTVIPTPTTIDIWPLNSDLFYLDQNGQVWRQHRLGDETTAAVISPEDMIVTDFAVSPGGDWILYRTANSIRVASIAGDQSNIISENINELPFIPSSELHSVSWSPDAGHIAFITETGFQVFVPGAGENAEPLIYPIIEEPLKHITWSQNSDWLLAVREDNTAAIYSIDPLVKWVELGQLHDHIWLSDGRLAFAPNEGGFALITPGDINSRIFLIPQDRHITKPAQRSDDTLALFVHSGSIDEPGFLHIADPHALSFRVENNRAVQTDGLVWDPAGEHLISHSVEPYALELFDPFIGGHAFLPTLEIPALFGWGDLPPQSIAGVQMSTDLYFLAPQAGVQQIWRLPANGDSPQALTSADDSINSFDVSPRNTHLVYGSDGKLWRSVINTLDVTEIASLASSSGAQNTTPTFSPTGRQIAYTDAGVWIYNLDTNETRLVVPNKTQGTAVYMYSHPLWSPDSEWLFVRVTFDEGYDNALITATNRPGQASQPMPLNLFDSNVQWIDDLTAYAYSQGGEFGGPYLYYLQPDIPPAGALIHQLPTVDLIPRDDGRIAFLRTPIPGTGGPTLVQVYSMLRNGDDILVESASFALESAQLSPDADFIAGLIHTSIDDSGKLSGDLVIANVLTGETFLIQNVSDVHHLRWEN